MSFIQRRIDVAVTSRRSYHVELTSMQPDEVDTTSKCTSMQQHDDNRTPHIRRCYVKISTLMRTNVMCPLDSGQHANMTLMLLAHSRSLIEATYIISRFGRQRRPVLVCTNANARRGIYY